MASKGERQAFEAHFRQSIDGLLPLLYHENCPNKLTAAANKHEHRPLVVGHRSGMIDLGLAELIEALWEAGAETISSCEDLAGSAYIQFASPLHGGDTFAAFLGANGIQHLRADRPYELTLPGVCQVTLQSVLIHFPKSAIERVTAQWKRMHLPPNR